MKFVFIALLLFLSLFLESAFVQLPLVLITLIVLCVTYKQLWIFSVAFGMGILLDALTFRTVGQSSVLFTLLFAGIFLYQRRFEIQTVQFVFFFILIASFIFLLISQVALPIMQSLVSGIVGSGLFLLCQIKKEDKKKLLL